jgi:shikimate kinase
VVATGGSAVYCEEAMARLGAAGPIIYLEVALPILERRVAAAPLRGIASDSEQDFADIFAERTPLYRNHADLVIDASQGSPEEVAAEILQRWPGALAGRSRQGRGARPGAPE